MSDEGFHEIQLNGKQLIFLCMTAALVLVVAFLTGVLVGRGVHTQADTSVAAADTAGAPAPDSSAAGGAFASEPAAPPITAIAPPTPADEDLTYNSRLQGKEPPKETVPPEAVAGAPSKAAADAKPVRGNEAKAAPAAATTPPPPVKAGAETAKSADTSVRGEPGGSGWSLKIAAFRQRAQADAMARRLGGKGYSAYVVRASELYSVRVGKYPSRREADSTRRRLEKEEQVKPLISR